MVRRLANQSSLHAAESKRTPLRSRLRQSARITSQRMRVMPPTRLRPAVQRQCRIFLRWQSSGHQLAAGTPRAAGFERQCEVRGQFNTVTAGRLQKHKATTFRAAARGVTQYLHSVNMTRV